MFDIGIEHRLKAEDAQCAWHQVSKAGCEMLADAAVTEVDDGKESAQLEESNVSLAPSLEGLTGSRIHSNANGASSRWREAVTERMHSLRLRALCTFDHCFALPHVGS